MGVVVRQKTRSALETLASLKLFQAFLLILKLPSIAFWQHDDDTSFQSHVVEYAMEQGWQDSTTGGYNPNGNALAERRIGMLNALVRVYLLVATGGERYVTLLWALAMQHARFVLNTMPWHEQEPPYFTVTSEQHPELKNLHPFGSDCLYRINKAKKRNKFTPTGG